MRAHPSLIPTNYSLPNFIPSQKYDLITNHSLSLIISSSPPPFSHKPSPSIKNLTLNFHLSHHNNLKSQTPFTNPSPFYALILTTVSVLSNSYFKILDIFAGTKMPPRRILQGKQQMAETSRPRKRTNRNPNLHNIVFDNSEQEK